MAIGYYVNLHPTITAFILFYFIIINFFCCYYNWYVIDIISIFTIPFTIRRGGGNQLLYVNQQSVAYPIPAAKSMNSEVNTGK